MKNPERKLFTVPVADIGGISTYGINYPVQENATFDEITGATLSSSIKVMGLDCPETNPLNCETYIDNVKGKMTPGTASALMVTENGTINEIGEFVKSVPGVKSVGMAAISNSIKTKWQLINGANPDTIKLSDIIQPDHFDWLKANLPFSLHPFAGHTESSSNSAMVTTVDAIQNLFYSVTKLASGAVSAGITWDSIKSILVRAIQANMDTDPANYSDVDHRVIHYAGLEQRPDGTWETDYLGVLRLDWNISVQNYKHKAKHGGDTHKATVSATARSIEFSDADTLAAYDNAVKAHFASAGSLIGAVVTAFPIDGKPKVFQEKPDANHDTFNKGVRVGGRATHDRLILYSGGLQLILTEDNTKSEADITVEKSVDVGFTTELPTKFEISTEAEVDVEVVTAVATLHFEFALSAAWNKEQVTTHTINCPAGATTYAYQGILKSAILRFDPDTSEFSYVADSDNELTTNYIVTSQTPLLPS